MIFMGSLFRGIIIRKDKLKITLGGAWNQYYGKHYGKVIWAQYASDGDNDRNWYYGTGTEERF